MEAEVIFSRQTREAGLESLKSLAGQYEDQLTPDQAQFLQGLIHAQEGAVSRAIQCLVEASEQNNDTWIYPLELGKVLARTGQVMNDPDWLENSLISLKRAVEINPGEAEIFCALATSYELLGRSREAMANLRRAVELLQEKGNEKGDSRDADPYPASWPLILRRDIHFTRFRPHGTYQKLVLESQCEDNRHVLWCVLWGYGEAEYPWKVKDCVIVEEGQLARDQLSESLPDDLKRMLDLTPEAVFSFAILKMV